LFLATGTQQDDSWRFVLILVVGTGAQDGGRNFVLVLFLATGTQQDDNRRFVLILVVGTGAQKDGNRNFVLVLVFVFGDWNTTR
jgi:hypothetical protein